MMTGAPICAWLAFWLVPAVLGDDAWLVASFAWPLMPPPPKLHTRTGSDAFLAPTCHAELRALDSWTVNASCPSAWTPSPPQPQEPPDSVCHAPWLVVASFGADAVEETVFSCDTDPSLPSLPMRTGPTELPNEPELPSHPQVDWPGS